MMKVFERNINLLNYIKKDNKNGEGDGKKEEKELKDFDIYKIINPCIVCTECNKQAQLLFG
jgi:hypothetical protein